MTPSRYDFPEPVMIGRVVVQNAGMYGITVIQLTPDVGVAVRVKHTDGSSGYLGRIDDLTYNFIFPEGQGGWVHHTYPVRTGADRFFKADTILDMAGVWEHGPAGVDKWRSWKYSKEAREQILREECAAFGEHVMCFWYDHGDIVQSMSLGAILEGMLKAPVRDDTPGEIQANIRNAELRIEILEAQQADADAYRKTGNSEADGVRSRLAYADGRLTALQNAEREPPRRFVVQIDGGERTYDAAGLEWARKRAAANLSVVERELALRESKGQHAAFEREDVSECTTRVAALADAKPDDDDARRRWVTQFPGNDYESYHSDTERERELSRWGGIVDQLQAEATGYDKSEALEDEGRQREVAAAQERIGLLKADLGASMNAEEAPAPAPSPTVVDVADVPEPAPAPPVKTRRFVVQMVDPSFKDMSPGDAPSDVLDLTGIEMRIDRNYLRPTEWAEMRRNNPRIRDLDVWVRGNGTGKVRTFSDDDLDGVVVDFGDVEVPLRRGRPGFYFANLTVEQVQEIRA